MSSIVVPFELRDFDGLVTVDVTVNEDAGRWGYDVLGRFPMEQPRGFPVARATVDYPAEGYRAAMGWIQLVYHGEDPENPEVLVDLTPQHADAGTPYAFWGFSPTFFDAPSTSQGGIHWAADAFLATSPDALMTRTVLPVCGFRWGYATTGESPEISPPERIGTAAWDRARTVLAERFPAWEFLDADALGT